MKFEVGKVYTSRAVGDHTMVYEFECIKRTAKTMTVRETGNPDRRIKIQNDAEGEYAYPDGRYAKCPVIYAHRHK